MERLIEVQTAKLAKEKGFTVITDKGYYLHSNYPLLLWCDCEENDPELGYAPTQSALQTWLRNKHGLFAYIDWATNEAVCLDYKNTDGKELIREDTYDFCPDHEDGEVLERLLFETLKFIK